jgi:hypothetical protein
MRRRRRGYPGRASLRTPLQSQALTCGSRDRLTPFPEAAPRGATRKVDGCGRLGRKPQHGRR